METFQVVCTCRTLLETALSALSNLCGDRVSSSAQESSPGKESSDLQEDSSSIGNTLRCSCGKCKSKATHTESICCWVKEEIPESYFKVILPFVLEIFLSSNVSKEPVKTQLC